MNVDYERNMALVVHEPGSSEILGIVRYDVDPGTQLAEIAFVVRDDWQGRGVGTRLLARMAEIARARGLAGFCADVLATNKLMLMVFYKSGLKIEGQLEDNVYHLKAFFPLATPRDLAADPASGVT